MNIKKSLIAVAILALIASITGIDYVSARSLEANVRSKRVVAGTRFKVRLMENIDTTVNNLGSSFDATLTENIKVDDTVILPQGTPVRGVISNYKAPKRLSKGAVIFVTLDHILTTEGKQLPVKAIVSNVGTMTYDGGIVAGGNYGYAFKKNVQNSGNIFKTAKNWGFASGEDRIGGFAKIATVPTGILGGSLGAGGYFTGTVFADLFKKGEEVQLPAGTLFEVYLTEDLDVPVNY